MVLPLALSASSLDAAAMRAASSLTERLATLILLPIVLAYTGFAFRVMRGVVTAKEIEGNSANHY